MKQLSINSATAPDAHIFELYYEGQRIYPVPPPPPPKVETVVVDAMLREPSIPFMPRNRSERRAMEAQKRKKR